MQQATMHGASSTQGHALNIGEARKMVAHDAACSAAGVSFVPIVMETVGGMSGTTVNTLASIGCLQGQRLGIPPTDSIRHLLEMFYICLEWECCSVVAPFSDTAPFY